MGTCVIYNYAQHYRLAIFQLLNKELDCDFYFGDTMKDVKKLDYALLPGFQKELKNIRLIGHFYWQKGAVSVFFKGYNKYIILGEHYCLSTWILLLLSRFSNKKIYLWSHGYYGRESRVQRFIKKIFFRLSHQVFLYGDYARNLMIADGLAPRRLHVIYNSLYYSEQLQTRSRLRHSSIYTDHFNNNDPVILFIGRLTKEKKLEQLLLAHKFLLGNHVSANVVFIGNGEEENALKEMLSDTEKKRCWFYGPCYNEQTIGELIYNAAVCVSPGNVGLTAMHSLVYGTPVITHNDFTTQMPEFEAIVPGHTGDYFIKDNIDHLAGTIRKWLATGISKEEVASRCYQVIDQKYNPFFQVAVIKEVINKDN